MNVPIITAVGVATLALVAIVVFLVVRGRRDADGWNAARIAMARGAFERSVAGIGYIDAQGRWIFVNRKLLAMLGYKSIDEMTRTTAKLLTHPQDRKQEARLTSDLQSGRSGGYSIVKRLRRKDGEYRHYRVQMIRCVDAPPIFQFVAEEVAPEVAALEHLVLALDDSDDAALIRCNPLGIITGWNRGAERLFGYSSNEMLGKSWSGLQAANDSRDATKMLTEAAQAGVLRTNGTRVRRDAPPIAVTSTIVPYDRGRESAGFVEIVRPAEAEQESTEALRSENERLQASETELHDTVAKLITANSDLTKKVRVLGTALRKMVTARKEAATSAEAAPPAKLADLQWSDIAGPDIPALLTRLAGESKTGTLRLQSNGSEKRLIFVDGRVIACTSEDDRVLGQLLVDRGIINGAQRNAALDAHRASGVPFGSSVVNLGLATADDLADIMRSKAAQDIADAAKWDHARYAFSDSTDAGEAFVPVAIDVLSIVGAEHDQSDEIEDGRLFVGSAKGRSRIYHRSDCGSARGIAHAERVFFDSPVDAEAQNYKACKRCLSATA